MVINIIIVTIETLVIIVINLPIPIRTLVTMIINVTVVFI